MKIRVKEAHILHVGLPLKKKFKHAITTRSHSDSVFLRLILEDTNRTRGYGESLPREYVTGETPSSVIEGLKAIVQHKILGYGVESYRELPSFINGLGIEKGAVKCALELALFDAYGKHFNLPISSIIGECVNETISYSGVMQAGSAIDVVKSSLAFKIFDLKFIKVKVGVGNDVDRLKIARRVLGKDADIRVDANGAWSADEAIEKIGKLRRFNISAVEQPVRPDDFHELKKVTESVRETIVADESICTVDDAERLAELEACNMFNIRLSKCGGILNSLIIANMARRNKIGIQLGCQVGESGLLSAAGWHFASILKNIAFYEGSYGKFLLKSDITEEDMTIKRGGTIGPINGPGLGVTVSDEALNRYVIAEHTLSL